MSKGLQRKLMQVSIWWQAKSCGVRDPCILFMHCLPAFHGHFVTFTVEVEFTESRLAGLLHKSHRHHAPIH